MAVFGDGERFRIVFATGLRVGSGSPAGLLGRLSLRNLNGLGLFRSALRGKVEEVLRDIAQASAKLDRQGVPATATFTEDEKRRIAALLARPG